MTSRVAETLHAVTSPASPSAALVLSAAVQTTTVPQNLQIFADLKAALRMKNPVLMIVPHPAVELAGELARGGNFAGSVAAWAAMAEARLKLVSGARKRVLLLTPDVVLDPQDQDISLIAKRLGAWPDGLSVQPTAASAGDLLLATSLLAADPSLARLAEETAALTLGSDRFALSRQLIEKAWQDRAQLQTLAELQRSQISMQLDDGERSRRLAQETAAKQQRELKSQRSASNRQLAEATDRVADLTTKLQALQQEHDLLAQREKLLTDQIVLSKDATVLNSAGQQQVQKLEAELQLAQATTAAVRHRLQHAQDKHAQREAVLGARILADGAEIGNLRQRERSLVSRILRDDALLHACPETGEERENLDKRLNSVLDSQSWRMISKLRRR